MSIVNDFKTLSEAVVCACQKYPDNIALSFSNSQYTYRDLLRISRSLAALLRPVNGRMAAIMCDRNIFAYSAILASLLADKTYVPLSLTYSKDKCLEIIIASEARLLIIDRQFDRIAGSILEAVLYPLNIVLVGYDDVPEWAKGNEKHHFTLFDKDAVCDINDDKAVLDNQSAYLLFTSGSTGKPKGIVIDHKQVLFYINNIIDEFKPTCHDHFSQVIDLTFDLSVQDMFTCWIVGATLFVFNESGVIQLYKYIRSNKISFWFSVPSLAILLHLSRFLKPGCFPDIRVALFCGEPLSDNIASAWFEAIGGGVVENLYGPTEATIAFTHFRWKRSDKKSNEVVSIGKPFKGLKVAIVNKDFEQVSDEVGELCLSGIQVATGYYNSPELTNRSFIRLKNSKERWYRTGDLAQMDPNGDLIFKGRVDDQLQLQGCRVEKIELESLIRKIAKSEAVAVVPIISLEHVVIGYTAYVVGTKYAENEIRQMCQEDMPKFLKPTQVIIVKEFPMTSNGKVDYERLKRGSK